MRSEPAALDAGLPTAAELTPRALATGLGLGALLAVGNLYMGLKTGWWDSGSITASVLAFAVLTACARVTGRPASPLETNAAQTAASAVGATPAAAGLLGAVPALALLGRDVPGAIAAAWGLGLGALGVLLALALRRRLLEEERLPFPTGVATAEVIRAVHVGERAGGRALVRTGAAAALFTALRDAAGVLPSSWSLPGALAGAPASAYGLGLAASPMMVGAGLVAGPQNGAGVLLGAAVAWGALGPALVQSGAVREAAYGPLAAWLAWPGVALMLGSASVSLASRARALASAVKDLSALRRVRLGTACAAIAVGIAAAALAWRGFGLAPWEAALALLLAAVLGTVAARAAGQTDMIPAGEVGQLSQVTAALAAGSAPVAGIGVGAVASGAAAQAGVSLWALRAGRELGASVRLQALALLAGVAAGSALAVPAYLVLARTHGVGTAALPVPGALPWKALAEAAAGGLSSIPRGAPAAAAVAFAAGVVLELLARTRAGRFLPAAGAIGMGFIAPASTSAAIAIGSAAALAWRAARPSSARALVPAIGAGAIAGESLAGVAAAALAAAGLIH